MAGQPVNTGLDEDTARTDGGVGAITLKLHFTSSEKAALIAFLKTLTDSKFLSDPRFSDPFKWGPRK